MTFNRRHLSDSERREYDAIYTEACYDYEGKFRATRDAAPLLLAAIEDALQSHRSWAELLMNDIILRGFQAEAKRFQDSERKHETIVDGRVVSRKDAQRFRVVGDDGTIEWKTAMLNECFHEDLEQLRQDNAKRIVTAQAEERDLDALIELLDETGELTVEAALKRKEVSLSEYLMERAA
ncbi:MAG: hypothetical protein WAS05_09105 [Candidatus Nanopelagicales bacterium]